MQKAAPTTVGCAEGGATAGPLGDTRQLSAPRLIGASNACSDDFSMVSVIGAGAFASVGLVKHQPSGDIYVRAPPNHTTAYLGIIPWLTYGSCRAQVLKKMDRHQLIVSKMQKQIMRERRLKDDADEIARRSAKATRKLVEKHFRRALDERVKQLEAEEREQARLEELAAKKEVDARAGGKKKPAGRATTRF